MANENPNPELTKEELEAKREEITQYYNDHIPSLKVQLEYESLLKDIEKVRAERLQAQMFVQNAMAGPPDAPSAAKQEFDAAQKAEIETRARNLADQIKKDSKEELETKKRTLKKTT
mgnify:FL=1|jgi:hypothetical protein